MKIGYIQFDVKHDKAENFRRIERHMKNFDGELLVLPELCICGYLFESKNALADAAEAIPDEASTRKMQELSAAYNCGIVFGLAEKSEGRIYNTAAVVSHGNYMGKYRKVHLSDLEKTLFERGQSNKIIDMGGCKLGVQICFDLWFPEISREQVKQGAELLCALANFGGTRTLKIAQTRATENLTPLVMCNRVGMERAAGIDAYFLGESRLFDASGECIGSAGRAVEVMESRSVAIRTKRANVICKDFEAEMALHPLL